MGTSEYRSFFWVVFLNQQLFFTKSSENIAHLKSTNQSPGWRPSSIAVDGEYNCQNNFTHTYENRQRAWWKVDLGDVYEIKKIQIYYRENFLQRLNGYSINITSSLTSVKPFQCFKDTDTNTLPLSSEPVHICPHLGRYVNMSVERIFGTTYKDYDYKGAVINLCEFEVYGCKRGHYGNQNCQYNCSVGCRDSRCDPDNGNCECNEGWTGDKCSISSCIQGHYGENCQPCPSNCLNSNCNSVTGACTDGCVASYHGTYCTLKCPTNCNKICEIKSGNCFACNPGYHGLKCDLNCPSNCKDRSCEQISGICANCMYLYQGNTCTDCVPGHYGDTCSPCSVGCLNDHCNQVNGYCIQGCKPFFIGNKCEVCDSGYFLHGNTCILCSNGCLNNKCNLKNGECIDGCNKSLFGRFCKSICPTNCLNASCDRNNGSCNGCISGFYGLQCNLKCTTTCKEKHCKQDSGHCRSCENPFKGINCTDCLDGFYGENCHLKCSENCKKCEKANGDCLSCVRGKISGGKCSKLQSASAEANTKKESAIGPIIGGVVAAIIVILTVVVFVICLKRRRQKYGKENGYQNQIIFSAPHSHGNSRDNEKQEERKSNQSDYLKQENEVSIENCNDYINSPEVYMNLSLTEVPVSELSGIISQKAGEKEFAVEYDKLPEGSKHPTTAGKLPENKIKNRFLTTYPYDHSRVILKHISTQEKSDYINANYIDGVEKRRAYIATQGPKTNTLRDFWKMVWQEKSGKIVMLTNLIENEKAKCEQYWPANVKDKEFGIFKVTMEYEKEYAFFFERTLQLTNKKTKETRRISQFHFTMWPDHGTPDPVQLMLFHRKVKEVDTALTGPPVVHCAAGIGRTGTFIALDTLHDYGDKTGKIDVFEYVIKMRKDRMNMIQTLEQYVVLHEALLESFQYTGRSLSRNRFLEVCNELNKTKPKNQMHVYREFQNLSALRPIYGIESYGSALDKDNRRKSRNQNILAVEKYRPFLMSQKSSRTNFINAVILPTFRKKCGYFVTHYPLEKTVVDFWCMVFDHNSSTIVVLDEISDKDNVLHWYPDDEIEMIVDSFKIIKVSGPHTYGKVTELGFTVTRQDDEKYVQMLMIRPWPTGRCLPPDKSELLKLIEMTMTRQSTDPNPVTIVCSDGARCCGLFCIVSNVIFNLRIEEEIDIFHAVRQLQIRRPQFISDYEEYKSCYEMVKVFLESSNIYANV